LLSGKIGLHLACAGLRADLRQSLIVSTDKCVQIQPSMPHKPAPTNPTFPGTPTARQQLHGEATLNMELTADHCTFAAREATFYLDDLPVKTDAPPFLWPVVADPVVVQMKDCAFLNPFADREPKSAAALLAYGGVAVERGLLCWQSEGNVFDKRLHAFVARTADGRPERVEKPQAFAVWERLWGPGESKPILDVPLKSTIDPERPALEHLALPAQPVLKEKPGADLTKLLAPRKAK
jgi:hypothetical protein